MDEVIKQRVSVAIVEAGLCYCFDENLCHYHAELDAAKEREAELRAEITQLSAVAHMAADEALTFKKENAKLRGVVERLRERIPHKPDCEVFITYKEVDCSCGRQKRLAESADTLGGK